MMFSIIKRWLSSFKKPSQDLFSTVKKKPLDQDINHSNQFEKKKNSSTTLPLKSDLPRCHAKPSISSGNVKHGCSKAGNSRCRCTNCKELSSIGECRICLEPLQGQGILRSCPTCANLFCKKCSSKLRLCAFCRSEKPAERNRAVERILEQIVLPCRNSRNGCPAVLSSSTRFSHEKTCLFELVSCPTDPNSCHWHGTPSGLLKHLKKVHRQLALKDKSVNIALSRLNVKYSSNGHYTIFLNCYYQLFIVKIKISRGKIVLSFLRIGYTGSVPDDIAKSDFGVWMNATGGGREIGGLFPFQGIKNEPRDIEIHCNSFQSEDRTADVEDTITINIVIQKIVQ